MQGRESPKCCPECGLQGMCWDSRQDRQSILRRYKCKCGGRWKTLEMTVEAIAAQRVQRSLFNQLRRDLDAAMDRFFTTHSTGG